METAVDPAALGTVAVVATFLVPLVSMVKKPNWSRQAKYLLGMVASVLATVVGVAVDGNVDSWSGAVAYFATGLATAQTVYNMYFVNTEFNQEQSS